MINEPASALGGRYARSGVCAGMVSAFLFTLLHDLLISDIWFSLGIGLIAGALCGLCVGWSYALAAGRPSIIGWLGYNAIYVVMFALLGLVSVVVFEPITTIAALEDLNGPADELISRAMPVTILFTLMMAVGISLLFRLDWKRSAVMLLTCVVLVLFLGLNVSIIGLIYIPRSSFYLVLELFGLIIVLNAAYAAVFILLERKSLTRLGLGHHLTNPRIGTDGS